MKFLTYKVIHIIAVLALMATSFLIGLVVHNWPFLELEPKIGISDILGVFITIAVALAIPYFIKVVIERSSKISQVVHQEVIDYKSDLQAIQQRVLDFYQANELTERNKTELEVLVEISDRKLESLIGMIESLYGTEAKELTDRLKGNQIQFWQLLTGTAIHQPTYTNIDSVFLSQESELYQIILNSLSAINIFLMSK